MGFTCNNLTIDRWVGGFSCPVKKGLHRLLGRRGVVLRMMLLQRITVLLIRSGSTASVSKSLRKNRLNQRVSPTSASLSG
jgi:hypothetical protein